MSATTPDVVMPARRPQVGPSDRLAATVCLAIVVHALLVFGIGFRTPERTPPRYEALDVTLVTRRNEAPPEDAEKLAQANAEGGGDQAAPAAPATPLPAPLPDPEPRVAPPVPEVAPPKPPVPPPPEPAPKAEPTPEPPAPAPEPAPEPVVETAPEPVPEPPAPPRKVLTETVETPSPKALPEPPEPVEREPAPEVAAQPEKRKPTAAELIASSMELASMNAELEQRLDRHSQQPRRKYISASTREYKYAAYLEAWRAKVERVGNLNYPDAARNEGLSGSLLLDVALNPDGSVNNITVRRSSGHKVLDDAAVRIVELAAPYAPFPTDIRKETDILHITRTWQFLNDSGFSGKR